jgi:hypothetical protein
MEAIMRIIRAFKTLIQYYKNIMPVFLIVLILTMILSNILPLFGMILLLPLKISVAFVMLIALTKPNRLTYIPLHIGLRRTYYIKNVFYMTIQQILYLAPAFIGAIIAAYIYRFIELESQRAIIVMNLIIFSIPSIVISLMLAMVPFLLADPKFDQRKKNPLRYSAFILKGSYIKLVFMRLFFVPWLLWFSSGFIATLLTLYTTTFGGEPIIPTWISLSWVLSLPLKVFLIDPWYQMMHADLYVSLRYKFSQ